jgi:hypothetical protein
MTYQQVLDLINTKLANGSSITADEHKEVEIALLNFKNSQWKTGDIKEVDCDNTYINQNFNSDGSGKNERVGWQICNGLNGTKNRTGRVSVAWGNVTPLGEPIGGNAVATQFPFISPQSEPPTSTNPVVGGSKDAVVLSHQHGLANPDTAVMSSAGEPPNDYTVGIRTGTNTYWGYVENTRLAGESGTDKNMQPYIVTLFIQKV